MAKIKIDPKNDAIVPVDVQNDFCTGGSLAVPGGEAVVAVINAVIVFFTAVFKTQDWHPADHGSFASVQGVAAFTMGVLGEIAQMFWPDHCVQNTRGAEFHPDLLVVKNEVVVQKGKNKKFDSYSGVKDNGDTETGLVDMLHARGIKRVFVCGLATDYCVKATAIDLKSAGFEVYVITDACRGIAEDGGDAAFTEMFAAGCNLCTSEELLAAA